MTSREKILSAVAVNQPPLSSLPTLDLPDLAEEDDSERFAGSVAKKFTEIATTIGSRVFDVNSFGEIERILQRLFPPAGRVVSSFGQLATIAQTSISSRDPHLLNDVNLAVLKAQYGVAENGALWLSESEMMIRILPFICQHLALVIDRNNIVGNMHDAYLALGNDHPGFGVFIAGPSKTADIEQSLVLGAHGPRSLTIFII